MEGDEIHISDFFVGMNYSISLLDLYLNASLRVHQLYGIPVVIGISSLLEYEITQNASQTEVTLPLNNL